MIFCKMPYISYEEPGIVVILSLTSFLLLLNVVRYILDRLLYCGIIGQILIGIIWGLPVGGTAWLTEGNQETIQAFGYLGLICLVFEGGLSTDLAQLRKSVYISISVATIGLLMPIALSFILIALPFSSSSGTVYPTALAAFSAGASLCSTSLGTTFAILSSAGMQQTRVGVILVGAAMMDDVVGLVMVNIVTTLGSGDMSAWPIARPIVASFGLFLVTLAIVPYLLKPIWIWLVKCTQSEVQTSSLTEKKSNLREIMIKPVRRVPHLKFILSILVLIVFVTIAAFIDASVLFAAFIAGGLINYLWNVDDANSAAAPSDSTAMGMYEDYFKAVMDYILVPFFFASIGFSIPITDMFEGSIVWKGIVYAILMIIAKGLVSTVIYAEYFFRIWRGPRKSATQRSTPQEQENSNEKIPHMEALLVGFAMIARGEIGFLIASLSQSSGTLSLRSSDGSSSQSSGEAIFLVIVWAVVLCTIFGPVSVGILVRKLKRKGASFS
ncbi:sodium hydrogen exchanger family protein [Rutstroemia sp. NJR-2017a BVV2]|nr:sodium hydrogen exchanger family protein [Rutstroemia sp. NJR-2017a BVV2]